MLAYCAVLTDFRVLDAEAGQPILDDAHQLADLQVITVRGENDGDGPARRVMRAAVRDGSADEVVGHPLLAGVDVQPLIQFARLGAREEGHEPLDGQRYFNRVGARQTNHGKLRLLMEGTKYIISHFC